MSRLHPPMENSGVQDDSPSKQKMLRVLVIICRMCREVMPPLDRHMRRTREAGEGVDKQIGASPPLN